jgi:ribonuclease BN (tRNA processing enzyme)
LVLDAGTGARDLGRHLAGVAGLEIEVLLSHTHWDHIQGLPFFAPCYQADAKVRLTGPARRPGDLRQVLDSQMAPAVFPIPPSALQASIEILEVAEGSFDAAGWTVGAFPLCHPGATLGYRLEHPGVPGGLAYVTDNELAGARHGVGPAWRRSLVDFLQGVHTLVHDTTYEDEVIGRRAGWGHSSPAEAITLAAEAGCRRLVLFHHDPDLDDQRLDPVVAAAQALAARQAPGLEVEPAREGLILSLGGEMS